MQYALQRYVQLYLILDVSRADLLGSVLSGVRAGLVSNTLHKPLKVRFYGSGEDGVDHGGVQVELFANVGRKICDPEYGMFTIDSETQRAWFHQGYRDSVDRFEVIGSTVALAVYNGCTISVSFPKMMYMMLLGEKPNRPEDIEDIFPSLAAGLKSVLSDDIDIEDLELTFDYTYTSFDGTVTVPMRGSPSPALVDANKKEYVAEYIEHLSYVTIAPFFDAFKRGWTKLIPDKLTKLFTPAELMALTQGQDAQDFDVGELQRVTHYDDGYSALHPAIEWFWQIVKSFTPKNRLQLLEFVTACARVPVVDGISGVTFVIQRNGPDSDRLPTSLTCFGRLLLPEYRNKQKMEQMLRTAIEHSKGFGLV
ncbi:HECT-domain-containing protein [Lipomyces starkeyi]